MPSRWMSLAIIAFWLSAMSWLFWRELWPEWRGGEPPPFHIDLVEEVHKSSAPGTYWTVQCDGKKYFKARTWIGYDHDSDTFTLHGTFTGGSESSKELQPFSLLKRFRVESMTSEYCVNRAGQLQSLRAELHIRIKGTMKRLMIAVQGEVRQGQLFAQCGGGVGSEDPSVKIDLPPVAVSENGSVLMPLHPVNRIHGLRPGRQWRQPLIDPFRDAFGSIPGFSTGARSVNASVLPQVQYLDEAESPCLVIEYEDEGKIVGRTWVEQSSELVVRQEAILEDGHWIMQRDDPTTKHR